MGGVQITKISWCGGIPDHQMSQEERRTCRGNPKVTLCASNPGTVVRWKLRCPLDPDNREGVIFLQFGKDADIFAKMTAAT